MRSVGPARGRLYAARCVPHNAVFDGRGRLCAEREAVEAGRRRREAGSGAGLQAVARHGNMNGRSFCACARDRLYVGYRAPRNADLGKGGLL